MYLKEFKVNDKLCEFNIELTKEYLKNYYKSCGMNIEQYDYVYPTELATLSLKFFLETYPIPEGSIHTSQVIEIYNPINIDSKLKCQAFLSSSKEIRGRKIIVIKTDYFNNGDILATSSGTLLVPLT